MPARRASPGSPPRAGLAAAQITLTSDFGLRDPYVGQMKSRILQRSPDSPIIDLTHEITPFHPEQAGYWLWCVAPQFPAGTVHVAVVDPGVGGERAIIVLEALGQRFIAPDNGLLGMIASSCEACAYAIERAALDRLGLSPASATFHGRDIMAPVAAELSAWRMEAHELGREHAPHAGTLRMAVAGADGAVRGHVAVVDRYGNALTTIPGATVAALERPTVRLDGRRLRLVRAYVEAEIGECVALINSTGMLELAAGQASAARLLNIEAGREVYLAEER
jgi:S-adenosyl-L-methionine hydrolase (adenosine-forming)